MATQMPQDQTWPELVGKTYEEAKAAIEAVKPDLNIVRVPEGSAVTMDYRTDRVRIFVNEEGTVASAPQTG